MGEHADLEETKFDKWVAEKFGDKGSSTLINIKKHVPSMELKNLCRLGLSKIDAPNANLLGSQENILGCYKITR